MRSSMRPFRVLVAARRRRPAIHPANHRAALALVVFLLVFCAIPLHAGASTAAPASPPPENRSTLVSIDAVSQDVRSVIAQLAAVAGVNVVIDDAIASRVTVHLADVPFDRALDTIAIAAGAEVACEAGLYILTNARGYYPNQPTAEQTTVHVLDLSTSDFHSAQTLVQAVAKGLEVEPFPELGAVILRGPYSQVNAVRSALDGYLRSASYGQAEGQGFRLASSSRASMTRVYRGHRCQTGNTWPTPRRRG